MSQREIWLRPNRRALASGLLVPAVACLLGCVLVIGISPQGIVNWAWWVLGWILIGVAGIAAGGLVHALRTPRLAYSRDHLQVYLRSGAPWQVPIEVVECFFPGHGPSPGPAGSTPETSNLVIRLAESAEDWKSREVKRALGSWCDGYITIRGTWCEPIGPRVVSDLNRRLAEIHRERKSAAEPAP